MIRSESKCKNFYARRFSRYINTFCTYSFGGMFFYGVFMRIAVIGIVIEKDRAAASDVNEILSAYGDYIVGRMGVPDRTNDIYVISVIVKATNEIISSITGKLGRISTVSVKSAITSVEL